MEKKFRCHKISEGIVEGEALVSGDNIMFYLIEPDTVLVSSAIIMDIPMVDKVDEAFYETVKSGDHIRINADAGVIEILD